MSKQSQWDSNSDPESDRWLAVVRQHVASLRYGVVQIVVHEGKVTQIEKTERVRFETPRPGSR